MTTAVSAGLKKLIFGILRKSAAVLLGFIGVLLTCIAIIIGCLQIPSVRSMALAKALEAIQSPDLKIGINNIGGSWPNRLTLDGISLADAAGSFLTLDHLEFEWRPAALWRAHLHVERLVADGLRLDHLPQSGSESTAGTDGFSLPVLPVSIEINQLQLNNVALGKSVIGEPVALDARAALDWTIWRINTDINIQRRDAIPGTVDAQLSFAPSAREISAHVDLVDGGPGMRGIISNLADMPDAPSLTLKLEARNQQDRVEADLALDGGALIKADGKINGTWEGVWQSNITTLFDKSRAATNLDLDVDLNAQGRLITDNSANLSPDGTASLKSKLLWDPLDNLRLQNIALQVGEAGLTGNFGLSAISGSGDHAITGRGIFKGADRLLGEPGNALIAMMDWQLEGRSNFETGETEISDLRAASPGADLHLSGRSDAKGGISGLAKLVMLDLAPVGKLAGVTVSGGGMLTLEPLTMSPRGELAANARFETRSFSLHDETLDQMLGKRPTLATKLALAGNGDITASDIQLVPEDGNFQLGGKATWSAKGLLDADATFEAARAEKTFPAQGLAGRLSAKIKASGPADALNVALDAALANGTIKAVPVKRLDASVNLRALKEGTAEINFDGEPGKAKLDTGLVRQSDGGLLIDRLRGNLFGAPIDGTMLIDGKGLIKGEIRSTRLPLHAIGAFAGVPMEGQADLLAGFTPVRGKQGARLSLTSPQVEIDRTLRLSGFAARADVTDALGAMALDASLKISGGGMDGTKIQQASLTARGPLTALKIAGQIKGGIEAHQTDATPFSFDTGATLRMGRRNIIALDTLKAALGRSTFALAAPVTVDFTGGNLQTDRARIDIKTPRSGGHIEGAMALRGNAAKGDFEIASFPLQSIAALLPERARGSISGKGSFDTARTNGSLLLSFDKIGIGSTQMNDLPVLQGTLDATWAKRQAMIDVVLTGAGEAPLRGHATVPLVKPANSAWPSLPVKGPISGSLTWKGQLERLLAPIDVGSQALTGAADIDLTAAGDISAPVISGAATIRDGSYENFEVGVLIKNINATLTRKNDQALDFTLTGTDEVTGKLSTHGTIDLNPATKNAINIVTNFSRIHLVRRPEFDATLDGNIDIVGQSLTPTEEYPLFISGKIDIPVAEVRIPNSLPPSVPLIDVIEISGPDAHPVSLSATQAATPLPIKLDVNIHIPGPMQITGRGVNSLWRGDFVVTGTADTPVVSGSLQAMRGTLAFAGQNFTLARGAVNFLGRTPIDPDLDVALGFKRANFTATINVQGRSSDPQILMTSQPQLPQDEILAHILFNKAVGELSAFEAIQLANALAELSGEGISSGALLGSIQQTLGLDIFNFSGSGTDASLSAGKYFADDVYLGVRQGTTPGDMAVTVEIQITPNITLDTEVGATASTQAGVTWKYDY